MPLPRGAEDSGSDARGPAPPPTVSAIVIAHDRRAFLRGAVGSLLGQAGERSGFDIVVSKYFEDPVIDRFLASEGIANVVTTAPGIGGKIEAGFAECRGEVIAFLEDDDLWREGKLGALRRAFGGRSRVAFFHNAFERFSGELAPVGDRTPPEGANRPMSTPAEMDLRKLGWEDGRRILASGGLGNLSSIAVRRSVIADNLPIIRRIQLAPEPALFAAAARQRGTYWLDPTVRTDLRMHPDSATALPGGDGSALLPSIHRRVVASDDNLREAESYTMDPQPRRVIRMLRCSLRFQRLVSAPRTDRFEAIRVIGQQLRLAPFTMTRGSWMANEFGLTLRYALSPRWGIRGYLDRHPDRVRSGQAAATAPHVSAPVDRPSHVPGER